MLRKDELKTAKPTADAAEVARFNALAEEWWKPSADPVRNLEKAGALIAAEIDRLLRQRGRA